jgi:hypothetical protein
LRPKRPRRSRARARGDRGRIGHAFAPPGGGRPRAVHAPRAARKGRRR